MKKKIITSISIGLLSISALSFALGLKNNVNIAKAATGNYSTDADTYYNSISATSGIELLGELHDLMVTTHKTYTTYDDCKNADIVYQTDPGSTSSYVTDFYTRQDTDRAWGSGATGTWNREHVWCESQSIDARTGERLWERGHEKYGASDLHHLRPTESTLNTTRNNSPYTNLNLYGYNRDSFKKYAKNSSGVEYQHGGYKTGDMFEPLDSAKGDVARVLMYVFMHYSNYDAIGGTTDGTCEGYTGTFSITNIVSTPENTADAAWALLLDWNRDDPVSDAERVRNEAVARFQGNRNPFIDNESYADAIWGDGSSSSSYFRLSKKTASIGVEKTLTLKVITSDPSAPVTWTSSDNSVATVNNGVVTGVSAGTATIKASATIDGELKEPTCTVTVLGAGAVIKTTINWNDTFTPEFPTTSATVNTTVTAHTDDTSDGFAFKERSIYYSSSTKSLLFYKNKTATLPYLFNTEDLINISNVKITFSASTGVSGKVGVYFGDTELSEKLSTSQTTSPTKSGVVNFPNSNTEYGFFQISITDGSVQISSIEVTYSDGFIDEDVIGLSQTSAKIDYESQVALTATTSGLGTETGGNVYWGSSNEWVATVNNGVVTGVGGGTAVITATYGDATASCLVTVKENINMITEAVSGQTMATYELVNDASTLASGDVLVFVGMKDEQVYTMSSYNYSVSQNNVRSAKTIIKDNNAFLDVDMARDIEEYTLGGSVGAWTFKDSSDRYLYTSGFYNSDTLRNTGNYLKANADSQVDGNDLFSITITDGLAVVETDAVNENGYSYNGHIRFNYDGGNALFSGYASDTTTGTDVYLYRKTNTTVPLEVYHDDLAEDNSNALTFSHKLLSMVGTDICKLDGTTDIEELSGVWSGLMAEYAAFGEESKAMLKFAIADENGDTIQKAMSLYDYIVNKYYTVLGNGNFADTLGRTSTLNGANTSLTIISHIDITTIVGVAISLMTLAGFVVISRKKRLFSK